MGSQTPFYAFPYPLGTDRVADGDNAIQALAEKMEAVLGKGTGATTRAWGTPYPTDNDFTANGAFIGLISGTLTAWGTGRWCFQAGTRPGISGPGARFWPV